VFQFQHILPYALGWPTLIWGMFGFAFLPWKKQQQVARAGGHPDTRGLRLFRRGALAGWRAATESVVTNPYNFLRFALLLALLPPSFFYAKWTRFIAPAFPLFTLFTVLFLIRMVRNRIVMTLIIALSVIPGLAYLTVYTTPDTRFTASNWMHEHITQGSIILSETANVINIPVPTSTHLAMSYTTIPFNFYDLDVSAQLQTELSDAINSADYIVIPSRRVFANHPSSSYPHVARYYSDLFAGKLGFELATMITSYPRIRLFGKTLIEFPDEEAEETWTVFDHPVIRIYKKVQKSQVSKFTSYQGNILDFSDYKMQTFKLSNLETLKLLVADTPIKWERGLMYVRSKQDIGGKDGMLFTFPESAPRMFWNKNTVTDLTLIWMNQGKEIGRSNLPSIEKSKEIVTVSSPSEADTVIELLP